MLWRLNLSSKWWAWKIWPNPATSLAPRSIWISETRPSKFPSIVLENSVIISIRTLMIESRWRNYNYTLRTSNCQSTMMSLLECLMIAFKVVDLSTTSKSMHQWVMKKLHRPSVVAMHGTPRPRSGKSSIGPIVTSGSCFCLRSTQEFSPCLCQELFQARSRPSMSKRKNTSRLLSKVSQCLLEDRWDMGIQRLDKVASGVPWWGLELISVMSQSQILKSQASIEILSKMKPTSSQIEDPLSRSKGEKLKWPNPILMRHKLIPEWPQPTRMIPLKEKWPLDSLR